MKRASRCYKNYLHKLFIWADTNNMKYNAKKFELLAYAKEQEKNLHQTTNHMMIQILTPKNKLQIWGQILETS